MIAESEQKFYLNRIEFDISQRDWILLYSIKRFLLRHSKLYGEDHG